MDDEEHRLLKQAIRIRQSGGKDAGKASLALLATVSPKLKERVRTATAKAAACVVNDD